MHTIHVCHINIGPIGPLQCSGVFQTIQRKFLNQFQIFIYTVREKKRVHSILGITLTNLDVVS